MASAGPPGVRNRPDRIAPLLLQRNAGCDSRFVHAGQRSKLLDQALEEPALELRGSVLHAGQCDVKTDDVFSVEALIDRLEPLETPQKKAAAGRKQYRQCHFGDDERLSHTSALADTAATAGCL